MNIFELVDELFEAFAEGLGEPLAESARDLPRALRLAPERVPWSRVFSHEATLGAPALFAEAMPGVSRQAVRDAVMAHALAVIDAFGTDRIEDGQIPVSPTVTAVLGRARHERDRAIARLFGGQAPPGCDFGPADVLSLRAIRSERSLLESGQAMDMDLYERASLDKQCAGLVASTGLARVAGWSEGRCDSVRTTLESVWLGLQMADDVVDWEDDLKGGGAWAVCLMKGSVPPPSSGERPTAGASMRKHVLHSGVLRRMLVRAQQHMGLARMRASALNAPRLASWAAAQEARLQGLVAGETRHPGYAVRAHALAAWAGEVLS